MIFSRYEIEFETAPNARTPAGVVEGALVEHEGGVGCLQPWPSLGDLPLEQQIGALRRAAPTAMGRACLRCCAEDAVARREGRSLLDGLEIPRSHHLWDGVSALPEEVDLVKVKTVEAVERVPDGVRIRLDLNGSMSAEEFLGWAGALSDAMQARIDFVEDPVAYEAETWERLGVETGLRFALDRGPADATRGFAVRVWKPACHADPPAGELFCVTHNMDHEVGRRWAKYRAATFKGKLVECGLETSG